LEDKFQRRKFQIPKWEDKNSKYGNSKFQNDAGEKSKPTMNQLAFIMIFLVEFGI
jgi:hypothetical protein